MGFYARALLGDAHARGLSGLVEFAAADGLVLRVEPASALDDVAWTQAELWAPDAEVPVEIDVSRRADPDALARDELAELEEELDEAEEQAPGGIAKVRRQLARTQAVVAVRVLASDERIGPAVGTCVLGWYAQRDDVLLQVDAEGFYEGEALIVAV